MTLRFAPLPAPADRTVDFVYRVNSGEPQVIGAGPDGAATITLVPTTGGYHDLDVYAINADGRYSESGNTFSFNVA